jgi:smad nuclear-interacting protein 1
MEIIYLQGEAIIDTVLLSERSCWLVGRETAVVDMEAKHPSVSKQHAVIQFLCHQERNELGEKVSKVKPYLIDLDGVNGTMLNSKKVPGRQYLELRNKDMITFGLSTREYVLILAPE